MVNEGSFLVEPQQRPDELDVVLAIACRNRHRSARQASASTFASADGAVLPLESVSPVFDGIELAERDRVAGIGSGAFAIVCTIDGEDAGHPSALARRGLQDGAVIEMPRRAGASATACRRAADARS